MSTINDSNSIRQHSFADDLQLQMFAPLDKISNRLHPMQSCIIDIKVLAYEKMLDLNDKK